MSDVFKSRCCSWNWLVVVAQVATSKLRRTYLNSPTGRMSSVKKIITYWSRNADKDLTGRRMPFLNIVLEFEQKNYISKRPTKPRYAVCEFVWSKLWHRYQASKSSVGTQANFWFPLSFLLEQERRGSQACGLTVAFKPTRKVSDGRARVWDFLLY
jgi:hypothetical protein